ncbi:VMO1 protein, partial [Ardeotis kori]|nr:VMO1 protein [Ardeotis kori]
TAGQGGSDALVIAVSSGAPWGDWAWPEMCPEGSYASGVSFRVHPPPWCPRPIWGLRREAFPVAASSSGLGTHRLQSPPSRWGCWSEAHWCPHGGRLVGFALWVQAPQLGLLSDEVAATSARFACSDGHILLGPRSTWGQGGGWSPLCPRAVCGIQTREEPARGLKRDNTTLNDLCLFCC